MKGVLLAAVVLLTAQARAAPGDGKPETLDLPLEGAFVNPDWTERPSGDDINAVYPKFAQLLALGGRGVIQCAAEPDGSVDSCRVLSDTPTGLGFGTAAVKLAPKFRMRPGTLDGKPVRSNVTVPIRFTMIGELPKPPDIEEKPADPATLALAREVLSLSGGELAMKTQAHAAVAAMLAAVVAAGDGRPGTNVVEALDASLEELIKGSLDHRAHALANTMSVATLTTVRDFLKTPAGQQWASATAATNADEDDIASGSRLLWLAHQNFCAKAGC